MKTDLRIVINRSNYVVKTVLIPKSKVCWLPFK